MTRRTATTLLTGTWNDYGISRIDATGIDLRTDHDDIATDTDPRLEHRGVPFTGEAVEAIGDHPISQMFGEFGAGFP